MKAGLKSLKLDVPAAATLDGLLQHAAASIEENVHAMLASDDGDAPHQLRVALRRLRTTLHAFRPILRRRVRRRLNRRARTLGRLVARVRDADVLIDDILRPQDPVLRAGLDRWRTEMREDVRSRLPAATALASRLRTLVANGAWRRRGKHARNHATAPASILLDAALHAIHEHAARRGDKLTALPPAERHELRKDLKTLRYALDVRLHTDPDHPWSALRRPLRRLQADLGRLNDAAMLAAFAPELPPELRARLSFSRARALAALDEEAPAALARAGAAWSALSVLF